jgi:23S rRNA (cytidine1920-2'-O)/16S rRNA (cytidine1409-2'-O)-methyltransferase
MREFRAERIGPHILDRQQVGMSSRVRIDRRLVERGLFSSRAQAQAAIAAGKVTADDVVIRKFSDEVPAEAVLRVEAAHPYVSRGGIKLASALDHFGFDPLGRVCLDVGASTGGFSEVLLARGARLVYAIDVGHSQLHASLRTRPEIVSIEATDIRDLDPAQLVERPDFVTIDVSFISLELVLAPSLAPVRAPAHLVALVKPQFEAGRGMAKKGIVRDPLVHEAVCKKVASMVAFLGWQVVGTFASPVVGREGNCEFFIGALRN